MVDCQYTKCLYSVLWLHYSIQIMVDCQYTKCLYSVLWLHYSIQIWWTVSIPIALVVAEWSYNILLVSFRGPRPASRCLQYA